MPGRLGSFEELPDRAGKREPVRIGSDAIGEAVFMDPVYVGNLEGAGGLADGSRTCGRRPAARRRR